MSGTLNYSGSLSIGALSPISVSAHATTLAQLNAQASGLITLATGLTASPPNLTAAIASTQALLAQLQLAVTLGISFPGLSAQLAAIQAQITLLAANLAVLASLNGFLTPGGIFVYTYTGQVRDLAPAVGSEFISGLRDGSPPATSVNGVMLLTASPQALVAMRGFFGGAGL